MLRFLLFFILPQAPRASSVTCAVHIFPRSLLALALARKRHPPCLPPFLLPGFGRSALSSSQQHLLRAFHPSLPTAFAAQPPLVQPPGLPPVHRTTHHRSPSTNSSTPARTLPDRLLLVWRVRFDSTLPSTCSRRRPTTASTPPRTPARSRNSTFAICDPHSSPARYRRCRRCCPPPPLSA